MNEKHLKDRKVFVQIKGDSADASNRMKKQNIKPPRGNASTFRGTDLIKSVVYLRNGPDKNDSTTATNMLDCKKGANFSIVCTYF